MNNLWYEGLRFLCELEFMNCFLASLFYFMKKDSMSSLLVILSLSIALWNYTYGVPSKVLLLTNYFFANIVHFPQVPVLFFPINIFKLSWIEK